jgi:hypothetical protein
MSGFRKELAAGIFPAGPVLSLRRTAILPSSNSCCPFGTDRARPLRCRWRKAAGAQQSPGGAIASHDTTLP